MDLNYSTINLFPVPIHNFEVNGFSKIQDELIDYAYKLKAEDPVGNLISNRGGWQSSCFSLENEDDILQGFLAKCLGKFPTIKEIVNLHVSAWVNINPPDAFNMKHNHPTSDLAGVLWIKCPENCGDIIFSSPCDFAISNELDAYTDEFKDTGVIPKSFNAPRGKLEFLADPAHQYYKNFFDTDKEIVLYCQTGSRSALAGQTLVNMGYSKVSHMIGGFKEWMISSGNIEDYK